MILCFEPASRNDCALDQAQPAEDIDFFDQPTDKETLIEDFATNSTLNLVLSPNFVDSETQHFVFPLQPGSINSSSNMIPDNTNTLFQGQATEAASGVLCSESSLPMTYPTFNECHQEILQYTAPQQINPNVPNTEQTGDLEDIHGLVDDNNINLEDYMPSSSQESGNDNFALDQEDCHKTCAVHVAGPDTQVTTQSLSVGSHQAVLASEACSWNTFVPTIDTNVPPNHSSPNAAMWYHCTQQEDSPMLKQEDIQMYSRDEEQSSCSSTDTQRRRKRKGAMTEDEIQLEIRKKKAKDALADSTPPADEVKYERRKKQNRDAAARCREKKNGEVKELEKEEADLLKTLDANQKEVNELQKQKEEYERTLKLYLANCSCTELGSN